MKDRWGVVYCLKGGEWSCLLLKGCLEDFKCKGLQMNPAYIHLTQILQMKRYDKYRYYLQKYVCVELFSFVLIILYIFVSLSILILFLFVYRSICLPVYLSKNAGLFHSESVMPVYVSSLCYIFVHIYPSAFQYVCLSIYLLMSIFIVCLFVYMSTCLCLCLSVCISKCIFFLFCNSMYLSLSVSICIHLSMCNVCLHWIYVCLFVYKSIWLCICSSAYVCLSL